MLSFEARIPESYAPVKDPLAQEIAELEASIARDKARFAAEGNLVDLKRHLELSLIELRALKRAATLRPADYSAGGLDQSFVRFVRQAAIKTQTIQYFPRYKTSAGRI